MRTLESSIFWTLHYFDLFDYPLTSFEVWKYLWRPGQETAYSDVCHQLDRFCQLTRQSPGGHPRVSGVYGNFIENNFIIGSSIETKDGFYFLPNRAETIQKRKELFQISKRKIDKARRLAHIFQYIPYLRGIFLSNKVAQGIATEESDIDLFIVAEKGKTWTVRFFTLFILKILGLRPKGKNKSDTFCLCFYVDRENLSLEKFILPPKEGTPDIHYIYWFSAFLPLYDGGVIAEFVGANQWITKYLPNVRLTEESSYSFSSKSLIKTLFERFSNSSGLGKLFEKAFKNLQIKIMPRELKNMVGENTTNVLILDGVLKLHTNDRRALYRTRFIETIGDL